jgi:hypothetical protein
LEGWRHETDTANAWALLRATLEARFAGQPEALAKVGDVIEGLKNRSGNRHALARAAALPIDQAPSLRPSPRPRSAVRTAAR